MLLGKGHAWAVVGAIAWGCGGFYIPPPEPEPVVCSGGARMINNECFCAVGTSWDGAVCVGTPQQGTCAQAGSMQVQEMCFCPDGFNWTDDSMRECAQLQCTGGAVASVNECICPANYSWIDNLCQINCIPNAVRTDPNNCLCPEGTVAQGDIDGCQPPVVAGPVETPVSEPAPIQIRQQTTIQQTNQSFTCCLNSFNYTCPSQDAFIRCGGGDTSGCTAAGRC